MQRCFRLIPQCKYIKKTCSIKKSQKKNNKKNLKIRNFKCKDVLGLSFDLKTIKNATKYKKIISI